MAGIIFAHFPYLRHKLDRIALQKCYIRKSCLFSHLFQFQIITISPQALHIIFIKKTFNSSYLMTEIMACFTFCQNLLRERMIVTFLLIDLPVQFFFI